MNSDASTLGGRIKICADRVGSVAEMVRRTGIARSTLDSYISNLTEPQVSRLVQISEAAGARLEWLITGQGDAEKAAPLLHRDLERPAPLTVISAPVIDHEFLGQVAEMVEQLFREEDARPTARDLGEISGRLYGRAVKASTDRTERLGAVKVLLEDERAALRKQAADPSLRKSTV